VANDSSNSTNVADQALVDSALAERQSTIADRALFLKKFLGKGLEISSAVPSSPALVEAVLSHVDFSRPCTIVELGAGVGPLTEAVVERLRPDQRFVAVENDADFCKILRRRFPDTTLLEADATDIAEPLAHMGINRVDYVLSGLPSPNLPPRAVGRMWRWLRSSMAPDGAFVQITVAPVLYRSFYRRLFEVVDYEMVWMNLPPGGVYRCSRPRATIHHH